MFRSNLPKLWSRAGITARARRVFPQQKALPPQGTCTSLYGYRSQDATASSIGQGAALRFCPLERGPARNLREAAGIRKFRYRKGGSRAQTVSHRENLVRIRDLYGELKAGSSRSSSRLARRKRFLHLRDELRVLEVSLWLLSLEQLKKRHCKLNKDLTIYEKQLADAKQQQGTLYAQSESWPSHCAKLTEKPNVCETSCKKPSSLPPSRSAVRRLFRRTSATARRISSAHGRRAHRAEQVQSMDAQLAERRDISVLNEQEKSTSRLNWMHSENSLPSKSSSAHRPSRHFGRPSRCSAGRSARCTRSNSTEQPPRAVWRA